MRRWHMLLVVLALAATQICMAQGQEPGSKTVLGPRNVYLYDGANTLKAGDGEEGVRLTLLGLNSAHGIPKFYQVMSTTLVHSRLYLEVGIND